MTDLGKSHKLDYSTAEEIAPWERNDIRPQYRRTNIHIDTEQSEGSEERSQDYPTRGNWHQTEIQTNHRHIAAERSEGHKGISQNYPIWGT